MITIELEDKEMDYIARLLQSRPIAEALPLYKKILEQIKAQQDKQESQYKLPLNGTAAEHLG